MFFRNTAYRSATFALGLFALMGATVSSAQTISVLSGDGQLVLANRISNQPLIVQVKDASGKPLAGAIVNWAVQGQGTISSTQTTTDANGQSSTSQFFIAPTLIAPNAFLQSTVSASLASGTTVNFTESSYFADPATSVSYVQSMLISPTLGTPLPSAPSGAAGTVPIQITVKAINGFQTGQGIPHVALQVMAESTTGPTIACQGGIIYTDATGTATCTPVFGGVGTGSFSVVVGGGQTTFTSQPFTATLGTPTTIVISSGNSQSGTPGTTLTQPIVATVQDAAGNPIPNIPVTFTVETPGTVSFTNIRNTTDASGRASVNAVLGSLAGSYNFRVSTTSGTPISAEVMFSVVIPISGLSIISGQPQSAIVSTAFGAPLIVQVTDANRNGVAGVPVTFAVTQGSAVLGTTSVTTDASGRASTTVTAGATSGPLVITATSGTFTQSFSLTIAPPGPVFTSSSFTNTATGQAGGLAPGAIVTITGPGIAPLIQGTVSAPTALGNSIPMVTIAGVTVQISGIFAPILSVSNTNLQQSVTLQVPFEVLPGAANVTVTVSGVAATVGVTIQPYSPGLIDWVMSDNVRRAFILRPDGTVVSPSNPARRNETLRAYATGLGALAPNVGTTQFDPIDMDPAVMAPVVIGVNNAGVQVVSATYARNLLGVYEVRFIITDPGPSGNVPFAIAVSNGGTLVFGQPSAIPLQ